MNRIDRLTAILIQLQSKPLVKAQDLSNRFSISLRTVYRDVRALEQAGIPVIGEAGIGYRLMEGFKLPPIMFNEDEASALLTAAKLMDSLTDRSSSKYYGSALDKIRAVLRMAEKNHVADIDDHIAVLSHPAVVYQKPTELHLPALLKAIGSVKIIEFDYTSIEKNETLRRAADPVGIYYHGSHWYLVAYCHLRGDYRTFRTDRMRQVTITSKKMLQAHPPLQNFLDKITEKNELQRVVVAVDPQIAKYFGEQKYYNGFVKEERAGDMIYMTFVTSSLTGFARWFMVYGDHAEIIEPRKLKSLVIDLAEKILEKTRKKQMLLT